MDAAGPPGDEKATPSSRGREPTVLLSLPRAVHRATRLADGSVLVTGGAGSPAAPDSTPRTAVIFADGRVLLAGLVGTEGAPASGIASQQEARQTATASGFRASWSRWSTNS
jgi:hypothetical protein